MENKNKKRDFKIILYLVGYYFLGAIWLFLQNIPIPLGAVVGGIRIYKFYKRDNSFKWKLRTIILVVSAILAIFSLNIIIPFSISVPGIN